MKLKQYPNYKVYDYPNLARIPSHWKLHRNKYICKISKDVVGETSNQYRLLSLTLRGIIPRDLDNPTGKFPAEFNSYQKVTPDDLVFCLFDIDETPRTVGLSSLNGMITGAYTVVKRLSHVIPKYLYYYYLSLDSHKSLKPFYTGLRKVIKPDVFLRIRSPLPPGSEQKQIVKFLDFKSAQIAKFIRSKQRLIQLLKEQKQIIINQAVTRGIDSNVKMKPSGVDWLGEIPEHWEIRRLRTVALVRPSGVDKITNEGEIPVKLCNYVDVYKNERILSSMNFMHATATSDEIVKFELNDGDVLITKDSEMWNDIAVPAFVPQKIPGVICAYHLAIVRPMNIDGEYLFRAFLAESIADQFRVSANGVTRYGLSQGAIKDAWIPIPPKEEQCKIIEYINDGISKIHLAVEKAEKEIVLIHEYRTRLISDVVTGKLDVRNIKVEDVADEDLAGTLDSSEEIEEIEDTVEVSDDD